MSFDFEMYSVYQYPQFSTLRPSPGLMIRTQLGISSIDARVTNITVGPAYPNSRPLTPVMQSLMLGPGSLGLDFPKRRFMAEIGAFITHLKLNGMSQQHNNKE